jgi:hypothetical protein
MPAIRMSGNKPLFLVAHPSAAGSFDDISLMLGEAISEGTVRRRPLEDGARVAILADR